MGNHFQQPTSHLSTIPAMKLNVILFALVCFGLLALALAHDGEEHSGNKNDDKNDWDWDRCDDKEDEHERKEECYWKCVKVCPKKHHSTTTAKHTTTTMKHTTSTTTDACPHETTSTRKHTTSTSRDCPRETTSTRKHTTSTTKKPCDE